jgi:hypothetical protein
MPQDSTEETKKPVDKFTDGRVHVSIWENSGVKGAFRTATFQLRYKDQHDEWQTGHSFGASDLLIPTTAQAQRVDHGATCEPAKLILLRLLQRVPESRLPCNHQRTDNELCKLNPELAKIE